MSKICWSDQKTEEGEEVVEEVVDFGMTEVSKNNFVAAVIATTRLFFARQICWWGGGSALQDGTGVICLPFD